MNLVASTRSKLLLQGTDDLSQAQYELVRNSTTPASVILRMHDEIFGGNLRNIPDKNLDIGPFIVHDVGVDEGEPSDDAQDGDDEGFDEPSSFPNGNLLTSVTT